MDGTEMDKIVAFLQERLESEKPSPGEFTANDYVKTARVPRATAEGQLRRAASKNLITSRKLGQIRYWRILDQEGWQEWLEKKSDQLAAEIKPDSEKEKTA